MMDIAELQKLEISEAHRTPKTGSGECCIANGTWHVSINTYFPTV